jgi:hypothetical protein
VRHFEYLGSDGYLFVTTEEAGELTVRTAGDDAPAAVGDAIGLEPVAERLLRFDEGGLRMSAGA